MKVNGEAIYGTTASPFPRLPWGRCTTKARGERTTLYLHVFEWPGDGRLLVPGLRNRVSAARLLAGGARLRAEPTSEGVTLSLPAAAPDAIASVIRVEIAGTPDVAASPSATGPSAPRRPRRAATTPSGRSSSGG
jgi:alpha-L-fucosidase